MVEGERCGHDLSDAQEEQDRFGQSKKIDLKDISLTGKWSNSNLFHHYISFL